MQSERSATAGQAIYSKSVLAIYNFWVLGVSNSFFWKCPTKTLAQTFTDNATTNHLDVGVGTGYYPDRCLAGINRRLALLDLNANSLAVAAAKTSRFQPEVYQANVLEKLDLRCAKFDSISLHYLLHCLPGSLEEKSRVFGNLLPYLNDGGIIFGSTILGKGVEHNVAARKLMAAYNRKGIFDNLADDLDTLRAILSQSFTTFDIRVEGSVAVFVCEL